VVCASPVVGRSTSSRCQKSPKVLNALPDRPCKREIRARDLDLFISQRKNHPDRVPARPSRTTAVGGDVLSAASSEIADKATTLTTPATPPYNGARLLSARAVRIGPRRRAGPVPPRGGWWAEVAESRSRDVPRRPLPLPTLIRAARNFYAGRWPRVERP